MKIIVYSCNFGNYDRVKEPRMIDGSVDYILFTDNRELQSSVWQIRYVDTSVIDSDKQRVARYYKTNPHKVLPPHDYSFWIDSSFYMYITNFKNIVERELGMLQIACYSHPLRDCIYQEAKKCIEGSLDDERLICKQINKYKRLGFPTNYGLFASGFLIRGGGEKVKAFNELWWSEIQKGSKRDQLSQVYSAWRLGIFIKAISGNLYKNNPYIIREKHIHKMIKK